MKKKTNWIIDGEVAVGYTTNKNTPFCVDLDDYDRVKDFGWWENAQGYIVFQSSDDKAILLHRLVTEAKQGDVVDHINHDKSDNRKSNLRVSNQVHNMMNASTRRDNTSGAKGVWKDKRTGKWVAEIMSNKRKINLGHFRTFEEAVLARKRGEDQYFGDWSYANSVGL